MVMRMKQLIITGTVGRGRGEGRRERGMGDLVDDATHHESRPPVDARDEAEKPHEEREHKHGEERDGERHRGGGLEFVDCNVKVEVKMKKKRV